MKTPNVFSDLLLLSGNDLPFPEAGVTIHQPTLKEIAYIGETAFFMGCGFLNFSKKLLTSMDKVKLDAYDDFEIFMTIMVNSDNPQFKGTANNAKLVLDLIFPLYTVIVRNDCIVLKQDEEERYINKHNFSAFKEIITEMFNLNFTSNGMDQYKPGGSLSEQIANKLRKRHEQLAKLKNMDLEIDQNNVNILSRYSSILAVGVQLSIADLMQYTVYQLYDEFQRFQLKVQWDAYIQARMAGAKDLDEVDHWMIDLKAKSKKLTTNKKQK